MFEQLRRAWHEAVENFRRELHADDDGMSSPAAALARELAAATDELRRLEADLRTARRQLEAEREEMRNCARREKLAREIGDLETAAIAANFAERHRERAALLDRKTSVLAAEHALRTRELLELRDIASRHRLDPNGTTFGPHQKLADDDAFDRLEYGARERAAAARLEEIKRNMQ